MRKILPITVVGILVLSGLGAVAVNNDISIKNLNNDKFIEKSEIATITFSQVVIEVYISVFSTKDFIFRQN